MANGYKVKATRHGEAVAVNDVDGLHQLIANTLIAKREGNTKLADAMARKGAQVLGISRDSLASHAKFQLSLGLQFELLSDADETACKLFDVIREKNMYGKKVLGIERSTFLIDAKGVLCHEWRKVKVPGHAEQVLETLRTAG